ncbi:MAG: hypothetical protein OEY23_04650 [Acidimicrobiia bacterium]|nr:hypothetical protein [Acidimicrobiia bacterium]
MSRKRRHLRSGVSSPIAPVLLGALGAPGVVVLGIGFGRWLPLLQALLIVVLITGLSTLLTEVGGKAETDADRGRGKPAGDDGDASFPTPGEPCTH